MKRFQFGVIIGFVFVLSIAATKIASLPPFDTVTDANKVVVITASGSIGYSTKVTTSTNDANAAALTATSTAGYPAIIAFGGNAEGISAVSDSFFAGAFSTSATDHGPLFLEPQSSIPSGCFPGEVAVIGSNPKAFYVCDASNTWTKQLSTRSTIDQLAASTSSQLASLVSDETGSGALCFATAPSITGRMDVTAAATNANAARFYAAAGGTFPAALFAGTGTDDLATGLAAQFTCQSSGIGHGCISLTVQSTPSACSPGEVSAGSAGRLRTCSAANTWRDQINAGDTVDALSSSTSAQLATLLSDETGTQKVVFSRAPTLDGLVSVGTAAVTGAIAISGSNATGGAFAVTGGALFFNTGIAVKVNCTGATCATFSGNSGNISAAQFDASGSAAGIVVNGGSSSSAAAILAQQGGSGNLGTEADTNAAIRAIGRNLGWGIAAKGGNTVGAGGGRFDGTGTGNGISTTGGSSTSATSGFGIVSSGGSGTSTGVGGDGGSFTGGPTTTGVGGNGSTSTGGAGSTFGGYGVKGIGGAPAGTGVWGIGAAGGVGGWFVGGSAGGQGIVVSGTGSATGATISAGANTFPGLVVNAGSGGYAAQFLGAANGFGVYSSVTTGQALVGAAAGGRGAFGQATSGQGVWGTATTGTGVKAEATTTGDALLADSSTGTGIALRITGNATKHPIHVDCQAAAPTGAATKGDAYFDTNCVMWICTVAGAPCNTWVKIGAQ